MRQICTLTEASAQGNNGSDSLTHSANIYMLEQYFILREIKKNNKVTQRQLAKVCEISLASINEHLKFLEECEHIIVEHFYTRCTYHITAKGVEYMLTLKEILIKELERLIERIKTDEI